MAGFLALNSFARTVRHAQRAVIFLIVFASTLSPANAAGPAVVSIELSNFQFSPSTLQLRAGVPVVLHLINVGGGSHNFSAPGFFGAATVATSSAPLLRNGTVEVPGHSTIEIRLIPTAGEYVLKCTHTLHKSFGMKGAIIVR